MGGSEPNRDDRELLVLKVHRRQFLLAPAPVAPMWDWCQSFGSRHHVLHHCSDLPVEHVPDADGTVWSLLGRAIETDPSRASAAAAIRQTRTTDVPAISHDWVGRWLLIGRTRVYTDASGLLGCLYGFDAHGRLWASSSPSLLARHLLPGGSGPDDSRPLGDGPGPTWFPPPVTRFKGLRRLLPSQALDLGTGAVEPRSMLPAIAPRTDVRHAIARLSDALRIALERLADVAAEPLWLEVGTDLDTRLTPASARPDRVAVHLLKTVAAIADRVLSPELERSNGSEPHGLIASEHRLPAAEWARRLSIMNAHTAGHVSPRDALPLLSGRRGALTGISIATDGLAIVSGFRERRRLPAKRPDPHQAAALFATLIDAAEPSPAKQGFAEWLRWVADTPEADLDWRDRLFLEQRQAGWLAAKEQAYDMEPLERFPIFNGARIYATILSLRRRARRHALLRRDLITAMAGALSCRPTAEHRSGAGVPHAAPRRPWSAFKRPWGAPPSTPTRIAAARVP